MGEFRGFGNNFHNTGEPCGIFFSLRNSVLIFAFVNFAVSGTVMTHNSAATVDMMEASTPGCWGCLEACSWLEEALPVLGLPYNQTQ